MRLLAKHSDVLGCYNLTHYSFCRYCSYTTSCNQFRLLYYRTCLCRESNLHSDNYYGIHAPYSKMITNDFNGRVIMPIIHAGKMLDFVDDMNVLREIKCKVV